MEPTDPVVLVAGVRRETVDEVVGLAPYAGDEDYGIRGLHVYTFNNSEATEAWRRRRLDG